MTIAAPEPKANMGQPSPRIDGRLKVTGKALYAADFPVANPAFAILVTSPIARGHIVSFDLAEARAVPGVLEILTPENFEGLMEVAFFGDGGPAATRIQPLTTKKIWHDGQITALVIADTFDARRPTRSRALSRPIRRRRPSTLPVPKRCKPPRSQSATRKIRRSGMLRLAWRAPM
jgi:xanthine dehydrogenase YagR molybdenum-binding subunit